MMMMIREFMTKMSSSLKTKPLLFLSCFFFNNFFNKQQGSRSSVFRDGCVSDGFFLEFFFLDDENKNLSRKMPPAAAKKNLSFGDLSNQSQKEFIKE